MDGALTGFRPASRGSDAQSSRRGVSRRRDEAPAQIAAPRIRNAYPFSAIVGQEEMKRALMIAAVDPSIGGVLVFGDRGTGKSTAVRSLAALLPEMAVVAGCPYACDPASPSGGCAHCAVLAKGK